MAEKIFPSVSQILKPWQSPWPSKEDLERGAKRHSAYAAYLLGTWAPPIDPRDEGQFKSFRAWADKHIVEVHFVEEKLIDEKIGFSGTIDFDGILDFFTGSSILDWKPPGTITRAYRAQGAAYLHLSGAKKFGFLQPDPDGGIAKMRWLETSVQDFAAFLSALNCYRFFNQGEEAK